MSYPNDVTDAEWEEIKDFATPDRPGRPPKHDRRAMPKRFVDGDYKTGLID